MNTNDLVNVWGAVICSTSWAAAASSHAQFGPVFHWGASAFWLMFAGSIVIAARNN